MNFPNTPKRSSANDELDQVLNAWVHRQSATGEESLHGAQRRHSEFIEESSQGAQPRHSEPAEESPREGSLRCEATPRPPSAAHLTDALDFHRWADETLRSEPAAKGPAAGTWNRVLHHVEQKSPRGKAAMSATTAEAVGNAAPRYGYLSSNRKEMTLSRFANIAATVAIVFAVSVGGWFAMSQLPPGGDGRFGAFQASPEVAQSGTCDVEPLTVDEVMAIVENPYKYSYVADQSSRLLLPGTEELDESDLAEAWMMRIDSQLLEGPRNHISEMDFDAARDRMDGWLTCAFDGTVGQAFVYVDPFDIQRLILSRFPVYRDPATLRSSVETLLEMPAPDVWGTSSSVFMSPNYEVQPNSNIEDAVKL